MNVSYLKAFVQRIGNQAFATQVSLRSLSETDKSGRRGDDRTKLFGMKKIKLPVLLLSLLLPVSLLAETLETKSFIISITHPCEEGCVSCDKITYFGSSKKTGQSITLQGRTLHALGADGVTPSRFLGYRFRNGATVYSVGSDGTLTVANGDKVILKEQGKWREENAEQAAPDRPLPAAQFR